MHPAPRRRRAAGNAQRPDHGAYVPTLEEIREATRRIREEGFTTARGRRVPPWDEREYEKRAGRVLEPVEAPTVSDRAIGLGPERRS